MLDPDIEAFVQRTFAESDRQTVRELLAAAHTHDGRAADPRLLRCALIASRGTLKGLRYQLDGLAHDYRDVIVEAEYIRKKGEWIQVRDLSRPFEVDAQPTVPADGPASRARG